MDELIHQFLVQSGYPRAAILSDVGSVLGNNSDVLPSFVIVDPQTASRLAVLSVVAAVDADSLQETAETTRRAADKLGGKSVQGFVIRVDVDGANEAEQVQFYKVWPGTGLQHLTARTFPDLDSLRVNQKIALEKNHASSGQAVSLDEEFELPGLGVGAYLPGILLLLVTIADWLAGYLLGMPILGITQSILILGAAVLLTLPAIVRFQRS